MKKFYIYNFPTNVTPAQFVAQGWGMMIGAFNNSKLDDVLDAGYTGHLIVTSGKYRYSDLATALYPQGQVNLAPGTPEDPAANYQHNNIGWNGQVVARRDEGKALNFLIDAETGLVQRNSNMAMGYPMSTAVRADYAAYIPAVQAFNPVIPWWGHFHDDENVDTARIFNVGVRPSDKYPDPSGGNYFTDTLSWAEYRRQITESQDLTFITNVQGQDLARWQTFLDTVMDDAFGDIYIMNEFTFSGSANARSWSASNFQRYKDIIRMILAKPNGHALNVFHTDPNISLFNSFLAGLLVVAQDKDRAWVRPGEDYTQATVPAILDQVDDLGTPLSEDYIIEGNLYKRPYSNGLVVLDITNGQYEISYGDVIIIDPGDEDGVLDNTLPVITEEVEAAIQAAALAHIDLLDVFIATNAAKIVAGFEDVVYKPAVYDAVWILVIPRLIEILQVTGGYQAYRVEADEEGYYDIKITA